MKTCYYKTLSVSVEASQEEIKKAFRLLALRCHPDRNPRDPNASEHFRETLEAYETLIDPVRRLKYDKSQGYSNKRNSRNSSIYNSSGNSGISVKEALKEAFGIDFTYSRVPAINDLRFDLQLPRSSMEDGTYEWIAYDRLVFCCECAPNGRKKPPVFCSKCNGRGELEENCSLRVWIPAGSSQGSRLRISGAGDQPSPNARAGDLVILLYSADNQ